MASRSTPRGTADLGITFESLESFKNGGWKCRKEEQSFWKRNIGRKDKTTKEVFFQTSSYLSVNTSVDAAAKVSCHVEVWCIKAQVLHSHPFQVSVGVWPVNGVSNVSAQVAQKSQLVRIALIDYLKHEHSFLQLLIGSREVAVAWVRDNRQTLVFDDI